MDITGAHVYERRFRLNTAIILISFTYHSFGVFTDLFVADRIFTLVSQIFCNVLFIAAHKSFKQALGYF